MAKPLKRRCRVNCYFNSVFKFLRSDDKNDYYIRVYTKGPKRGKLKVVKFPKKQT